MLQRNTGRRTSSRDQGESLRIKYIITVEKKNYLSAEKMWHIFFPQLNHVVCQN